MIRTCTVRLSEAVFICAQLSTCSWVISGFPHGNLHFSIGGKRFTGTQVHGKAYFVRFHGCIAVTLVDVRERVIGEIRGHRSLDRNVTVAFRAVTRNSLTHSARGSYCREAVGITDLIGTRGVFPLFRSPPIKEFCQAVNITALPCLVDIFSSFNITINVISPLFHYSGSDFIFGPLFQNCSPLIFFTGFKRQAAIVAPKDHLPDKLSDPSPFCNHIKRPVL